MSVEQALQNGDLYPRSSRPHRMAPAAREPPTCSPAHPEYVTVGSEATGDLMDAEHPVMIGQGLDSMLVLVERIGCIMLTDALRVKSPEETYSSWLYLLPSLM